MKELAEIKHKNSNLKIREKILDFESLLSKTEGAAFGDDNGITSLKHSFSDGIYAREIFIPKGTALTGKIHKHDCHIFLMKGDITIVSEEGKKRLKAPCSFISTAGVKRVGYAHEDTIWVNVHSNLNNTRDMKEIEKREIAESYLELENYKKQITQGSTSCGLEALKKLSPLSKTSLKTLIDLAEDNGVTLYPYAISDGEQLMSIPLPAIVHSENHFDYVSKKEDFDFNKEYTGYVLLTKESDYKKIKKSKLKNIKGESWVAAVAGSIALTGTIIKSSAESVTECGKKCRSKCKSKYGTFEFSAKNKCKKSCKGKCMNETNEPPSSARDSESNTGTYILVGVIIIAIIGLIWWAYKKK